MCCCGCCGFFFCQPQGVFVLMGINATQRWVMNAWNFVLGFFVTITAFNQLQLAPRLGLIWHMYDSMIRCPIRRIYLHGPTVGGFGGWQGKTEAQICAQITGQSESMWGETNSKACSDIIEQRFTSAVITFEQVCYFLCLFRFLQCCNTLTWLWLEGRILRSRYDTRKVLHQEQRGGW